MRPADSAAPRDDRGVCLQMLRRFHDVFKRTAARLASSRPRRMTVLRSGDCASVSILQKHNEANGEENRDGTNSNYSDNHGKIAIRRSA